MSPEECRALAAQLRQYGEDNPGYLEAANEAADHLEAVAAKLEKDRRASEPATCKAPS